MTGIPIEYIIGYDLQQKIERTTIKNKRNIQKLNIISTKGKINNKLQTKN